jgi:hypothetical protein
VASKQTTVRVVASHGVQGLEHWEDGGHVAMVSLHNEMSQQQPTSERTGTPPTSIEQDVVVEPALKLAGREVIGKIPTREGWDMAMSEADHARRKGSYWNAFPTTSSRPRPSLRCQTYTPRLRSNQCGKCRRCETTRRQITPARPGLRTDRLTDRGQRHTDVMLDPSTSHSVPAPSRMLGITKKETTTMSNDTTDGARIAELEARVDELGMADINEGN